MQGVPINMGRDEFEVVFIKNYSLVLSNLNSHNNKL